MKAVTIHDMNALGCLGFDLIDILRLCESEVSASLWNCRNMWWLRKPTSDSEFTETEQHQLTLTGDELLDFAASLHQFIDGELVGTFKGEAQPWLIIVAADSSYYVVLCQCQAILDRVSERFKDVRESSDWTGNYAQQIAARDAEAHAREQ